MTDLDRRIAEALNDEDRDILSQFDEEGLFAQVVGIFRGKLGWITALMTFIALVLTIVGIYAVWKFITVDELMPMLRWGALAWALLTAQMMIKLWTWMHMGNNRVIREVKRLELQIARSQLESQ